MPERHEDRKRRNRAAELRGLALRGGSVRPELAFVAGAAYELDYIEEILKEHPTWTIRTGMQSDDGVFFVVLRGNRVIGRGIRLSEALEQAKETDSP